LTSPWRSTARRRVRTRVLATLALTVAAGAIATVTMAAATPPAVSPVVLPRDHASHAGMEVEWWYTAGTVTAVHGDAYFWFATVWAGAPGLLARVNLVDLRTDRIVLAHEYPAPGAVAGGLTEMRAGRFRLGWQRRGALGRWSVDAPTPAGRLTLTLTPQVPYVLHGRRGIIEQGPGGPSAYYSEPRLAARGVLVIGGRRRSLRGEGWLDHQWGNFAATPGALRWNWFACQLRDGRDLMLYQFLDRRDRPTSRRAGTLVSATGAVEHLHRFSARGLPPFVTPAAGRLTVPGARLYLTVRSLARHQYIANRALPSFWEGAATVTSGPAGSCIVESSRGDR
jgi:predicted secreted hydrolase